MEQGDIVQQRVSKKTLKRAGRVDLRLNFDDDDMKRRKTEISKSPETCVRRQESAQKISQLYLQLHMNSSSSLI